MLKSLKIENFRCFKSFELQQLGRINLLLGANNSGKTSILEALQLLRSQTNFETLGEIMINRGEYIVQNEYRKPELVLHHLFFGHKVDMDSQLSISDNSGQKIVLSFVTNTEEKLLLQIHKSDGYQSFKLPFLLSSDGNLLFERLNTTAKSFINLGTRTQFVTSSSLKNDKMIELFDEIVLLPEEEVVTQALRAIESSIERIATIGIDRDRYPNSREGFLIKLSNNKPIPIGSMGDGMWRILGLALAIANAKDGVLLVDEIDTGLHFTAMTDMWKMIWETAKRLNVQVFATTHSSDCWQSLAEIINEDHHSEDGITIHRIEKDTPCSIIFNEKQIAIAAKRNLEVR